MQFLKTLLWVVVAMAVAIFSYNNWVPVSVDLWGGLILDTLLPVLLIAAFLAGVLPTWLWHRASRWTLNRKLTQAERALEEARAALAPKPVTPPAAIEAPTPAEVLPPGAAPIAVPPGVS